MIKSCYGLQAGDLGSDGHRHGVGYIAQFPGLAGLAEVSRHNPVDPFFVRVEFVIAELEAGDEVDDEAGADAEGEAQDVDGRIELVLGQGAPGDLEVVEQHTMIILACWIDRFGLIRLRIDQFDKLLRFNGGWVWRGGVTARF